MRQDPPTPPVRPPGTHLGLQWRTPDKWDLKELSEFAQRVASRDDVAHVPTERELAATALSENALALVGVDGGDQIRASAWVTTQGEELLGFGLVDSEWRGQGIGRALLAWQVDVANALRGEGQRRLHAFVDDGNIPRRRLHAAAGFAPRCQSVHLIREVPAAPDTPSGAADSLASSVTHQVPDTPVSASGFRYAADATERELADYLNRIPRSTKPCTFAQLLHPDTAAAVYSPDFTVVARDAQGDIRAVLLSTEAVRLPGLEKHGIPSKQGQEIQIVETHLLMADKPEHAQALLHEGWRVMRAEQIDLHIVHLAVHSPLRAAVEQLGYSEGSSQTRFAATF